MEEPETDSIVQLSERDHKAHESGPAIHLLPRTESIATETGGKTRQ